PPGFAYVDADGGWAISGDGRLRARLVQPPRGAVLKGTAWRPGSSQIAYAATAPYQRGGNNGTDVRVVDWDGTGDRVLVEHGEPDNHLEWPTWSPDGRWLYVSHSRPVYEGRSFQGEA